MNAELIMQIVEESKEVPNESLRFDTWWCEEDGVVTMCPMGNHITRHTELIGILKVNSEVMNYKQSHKRTWRISTFDIAKYLDISQSVADALFNDPNLTRDSFVDLAEGFVHGEIAIRECHEDQCCRTYITDPDDKASVCPDCKEHMMEMCGL